MVQRRSPWPMDSLKLLKSSRDSGVVLAWFLKRPPMEVPKVPIELKGRFAARKMAFKRAVVVVLPLVPVIPIRSMWREGWS